MRIKKGDKVIVIAGKDKGKQGVIAQAFPREEKVVIEGINIKKVHQKGNGNDKKGQIIEKAYPVHVSNVMFLDPKTQKGTRIEYKVEKGKKVRVAKKSGTVIS